MSNNKIKPEIRQTSNTADFAQCATLMAGSDPWLAMGISYEECLSAFGRFENTVFVLQQDDSVLGFVMLQEQGSFKGYIKTLCINENYRGLGYGSLLLQFCEQHILAYSPNLFICVSAFNQGALKLYTRFGFELVGELPNFVKQGFTELLMRKTAGPISGYLPPCSK